MIYFFLLLIVPGFFWNYFFFLDLVSHFYLQFFIISCLLIFWYFFKSILLELFLSILLWIFLLSRVVGTDFSSLYSHNTSENPDIFYMNSEYFNKDIDGIADYIKQVKPKQIVMLELNNELFEKIKQEHDFKCNYYYSDDIYSFGFFTNEEILEQEVYLSGGYPVGYFKTTERSYYIIHPLFPVTTERFNQQKTLFSELVSWIKDGEFIILGEFNSAPYSKVFQSYFWKYAYESLYSWGKNMFLSLHINNIVSDSKLKVSPGIKQSSNYSPLLITF